MAMRQKLFFAYSLTTALIFSAVFWLESQKNRELVENYVVERLEHEIDSLLTKLNIDAQGVSAALKSAELVFQHAFSGHFFHLVLRAPDGKIIKNMRSVSLGNISLVSADHSMASTDQLGARERHFRIKGPDNRNLLGAQRVLTINEQRLIVVVAEDIRLFERHFNLFQQRFAWLCLVLYLVGLVLAYWFIQRTFRSLDEMQLQLRQLERGDIRRLETSAPQEIRPLVREINWLLEHMEQRVKRSRTALDNLAHTLKRPLTLLTQVADASNGPDGELQGEQHRLLQENTQLMQSIIERILRRARLADPSLPGQLFSVDQEVPALVQTLRSLYYQKNLEITLELVSSPTCRCDREDMFELLGNLLDNACKWARHRIHLRCEVIESQIHFSVDDDGPGCPKECFKDLAGRGIRVDESTEGHGLGLAIVTEILEQYGGELTVSASEMLGGFHARCILPITQVQNHAGDQK